MVQQAANWCRVCCSGVYETKKFEANTNASIYMGNIQRSGSHQSYGNIYNCSCRNHLNFSLVKKEQNKNQAERANQFQSEDVGKKYPNHDQGELKLTKWGDD